MLKQRVITALALIFPFAAATVWLPPFWFALLIGAVVLAAGWEWSRLAGLHSTAGRLAYLLLLAVAGGLLLAWLGVAPGAAAPDRMGTMLALGFGLLFWILIFFVLRAYPGNRRRWCGDFRIGLLGVPALLPCLLGVVYLKYLLPTGFLVLGFVILIAAVDIGAYFVGRKYGRRQLAAAISPKKSWEGVWGGLALCITAAAALAWLLHRRLQPLGGGEILLIAALALLTTAFCVIGDLLESMLKRIRDTKDSGKLLPGHGGLLDRVDGLLAATPVFVLGMMLLLEGSQDQ